MFSEFKFLIFIEVIAAVAAATIVAAIVAG